MASRTIASHPDPPSSYLTQRILVFHAIMAKSEQPLEATRRVLPLPSRCLHVHAMANFHLQRVQARRKLRQEGSILPQDREVRRRTHMVEFKLFYSLNT